MINEKKFQLLLLAEKTRNENESIESAFTRITKLVQEDNDREIVTQTTGRRFQKLNKKHPKKKGGKKRKYTKRAAHWTRNVVQMAESQPEQQQATG